MSTSKAKIASQFVLDTPPGEIYDVVNDIKVLLDDEAALESEVLPALRTYNIEQFATVTLPEKDYEVVLSKEGHVEGDVFLDPRSKQKFTVDHLQLSASNVEPAENQATNELRDAIDEAAQKYIADRYPKGATSVFASGKTEDGGDDSKIVICIVSNKYNLSNFWSGRWRSIWEFSESTTQLVGTLQVKVHYFEEGNVQMDTKKEVETSVDLAEGHSATAKRIFEAIGDAETKYQNSVNESFLQLSEGTFKALRRNLPMTRNKIDWNKVVGYKLGAELANKA